MGWARLDDNFHAHPKTYIAELDGCGLFCKAISYCAHYLTDGFIPERWVQAQLPGTKREQDRAGVVNRLIEAGMFERVDGGYLVHGYLDLNPSRTEAQKASTVGRNAARMRWAKRDASEAQCDPHSDPHTDPVPIPIEEPNGSSAGEIRPEVERLCSLLCDLIEQNGSKRPTTTKAWRDACRLMLDRDGRSEEQVERAIRWSQADEFWRSNVLSMPTLRKQYERLRLAALRGGGAQREHPAAARERELAELQARLEAEERAA